jgi:hypothetical protein
MEKSFQVWEGMSVQSYTLIEVSSTSDKKQVQKCDVKAVIELWKM